MSKERCSSCLYFVSVVRHDPGLSIGGEVTVPEFDYTVFFCCRYPQAVPVSPDCWCGEFKQKEEKHENAR